MIKQEQVIEFLGLIQDSEGGYTREDITKLAELMGVSPRGMRMQISYWIKTNKKFSQFIYLGKEKPSITLFEFFKIEHGLELNPIQVKKGIYEDIQGIYCHLLPHFPYPSIITVSIVFYIY